MSDFTAPTAALAVWHSEWGDMKCLVTDVSNDPIRAIVTHKWMTEAFKAYCSRDDDLEDFPLILIDGDRQEFTIGEDVVLTETIQNDPVRSSNGGRWKFEKTNDWDVTHILWVNDTPILAID